MAERLERSRGWIVKQALEARINEDEERDRPTREALQRVDSGYVINLQAVEAWAARFGAKKQRPTPRG